MKQLFIVALVAMALSTGVFIHAQDQDPTPIVFVCEESDACVEIVIVDDPIEHGCLTVGGTAFSDPCAIRGHFDPSLWHDAERGRLWLAYTRVSLFFPGANDYEVFAPTYDTHLAYSDDGGISWQYATSILEGAAYDHAENGPGVIAHEVPDIVQNPDGSWSLLWLHYTRPYMVTAFNDPVVGRKDADTPTALADAEVQLHLSGWGESDWFQAEHTPALDAGLSNCLGMTEPAAFTADGRSYVIVECLSVNIFDPAFPLIYEQGTLELFEWLGGGYAHIGTLLTHSDALALTDGDGTQVSLTQADVNQSRTGEWLLLVTPNDAEQDPPYQGCRVLTIDDLEGASVRRDADGLPVLRATIIAQSEHLGAGQCTYDPGSETGVTFSRGFDLGDDGGLGGLRLEILATGVHP